MPGLVVGAGLGGFGREEGAGLGRGDGFLGIKDFGIVLAHQEGDTCWYPTPFLGRRCNNAIIGQKLQGAPTSFLANYPHPNHHILLAGVAGLKETSLNERMPRPTRQATACRRWVRWKKQREIKCTADDINLRKYVMRSTADLGLDRQLSDGT